MEQLSTNSAHEETPLCLTGEYVKLWPYIPDAYPRDILYRLWRLIEDDGAFPRLFWGHSDPEQTRMDLPKFCRFSTDESRQLLFITTPDGEEIIGCTWWEDMKIGHQAFGALFMVKEFRGMAAVEATRLSSDWAFAHYQCIQLWALTPWPAAAIIIAHSGYERVATLPQFAISDGKFQDVGVFRKVRE